MEQIRTDSKNVLESMTKDELLSERNNLRWKMHNMTRGRTNANPHTHPDMDFELPENAYQDILNEMIFTKLYQENHPNVLFDQFVTFVTTKTDMKIISQNDLTLTISGPKRVICTITLIKDTDDYK